jgi:hypothetical protein
MVPKPDAKVRIGGYREGGVGMPRSQLPSWPIFRRVWRRAELFERAAAELEIDMLKAARIDGGTAIMSARDRCFSCARTPDCRDWLEASEGLPLPTELCANSDFFRRCLEVCRPVAATADEMSD